jgi:hypothetical protein
VGAIDGLDKAIKSRNDLIVEFQRSSPLPPKALAEKYFGLKRSDGVTDEKYSSIVMAIVNQTDDCIFFSRILADDLREYGKKLGRRHAWRLRLGLPKLTGPANWSEAERRGLIPPREQYEGWLRGFQKKPSWFRSITDWVRSHLAKIRANLSLRSRRRRLRTAWRPDRRS